MGNQISQSARLKIKVSKMRSKANDTSEDDSTDRSSKQDEPPENISSSVFYEIEDDEINCDTKINVNSFKINYDENAEPLDSDNSSDKLSKSDSSEVLNNNKDESKSFLKKMLSRQRAVSDDCERLDDDDNPTVLNISKETSELSDENENVEIRRSLIHSTSEGSEESGESTAKLFKKKRNRLSWGGASTKKSTDETDNRRSLSNNNLAEVTEEVVTDHKHRKFSRTRSIAVSRQEMGTALNTLSGNVKGGGRMAINKVSNVFHKYDNNDIKQCIDPGTKVGTR
ncbi:unnamed protein product [Meganyctiphanes norvegica]|uniref:Uncharacterized protein n=1 Tax=Meganyctiphanes norvegica TaxID=48144 RepID=A0AAV2Q2C6_MEGNR